MHHFSKRSTPIMADEAMPILGLDRAGYHALVRAGRLARSVRPGDAADREGQHSFWDLLGCGLWLRLRLAGLSEPVARTLAREMGDLLATAEGRGAEGRSLLDAHPLASRMRGHHDALLGATISVLRRTHALLRDAGPPRPNGARLVATLPRHGGAPGVRVLAMGWRQPEREGRDGAPRLSLQGAPVRPRAPA